MGKILKSVIVGFVVPVFAFSAVVCCCLTRIANAHSLSNVAAPPACHSCPSSQESPKSHDCACVNAGPAVMAQLAEITGPSGFKELLVSHFQGAIAAFQNTYYFPSVKTAYGGIALSPPQLLPLYLKTHNLRL